jgi:hypothetical protein
MIFTMTRAGGDGRWLLKLSIAGIILPVVGPGDAQAKSGLGSPRIEHGDDNQI